MFLTKALTLPGSMWLLLKCQQSFELCCTETRQPTDLLYLHRVFRDWSSSMQRIQLDEFLFLNEWRKCCLLATGLQNACAISLNPRIVVACSPAGVWFMNTRGHGGYQAVCLRDQISPRPKFQISCAVLGETLTGPSCSTTCNLCSSSRLGSSLHMCRPFCRKKKKKV